MTPHLKGTTIVDFIFMVHTTKWIEENLQVVCSSAIVLTAASSGGAEQEDLPPTIHVRHPNPKYENGF